MFMLYIFKIIQSITNTTSLREISNYVNEDNCATI